MKKIKNTLLFLFALVVMVLFLSLGKDYSVDEIAYGVTFSKKHAEAMQLDWQDVFIDTLDELKVKKLRLVAYWDEVESSADNYSYDDLDWQIDEAGKRQASVILAIGGRLPRWPECHFPAWTAELTKEEREDKILSYLLRTVERYRGNKNIVAWQVENEPFLLHFGECPKLDPDFLDREIALVRQLDSRPIVVTDSGELSLWIPAAKRADIFGTTMYRDTYSDRFKSYIHYPITPGFFKLKKNLASFFANPAKWVVIELQAEPWGPKSYREMSAEERDKTMSLQKFKDMIEFANLTGFNEFYLWGVEWWYWEKDVNKRPEFWDEAKALFDGSRVVTN